MAAEDVARDFGFLKGKVLAVLVFGSSVSGEGRDIDVCVVAPGRDPKDVLMEIFAKVDVVGKKYDVWVFEELPLYMKMEVIENHAIAICEDELELYEYFYRFRKLWKDQEHRCRLTDEDVRQMLAKRNVKRY